MSENNQKKRASPRKFQNPEEAKKARLERDRIYASRASAKRALENARTRIVHAARQAERLGLGELLTEEERKML